MHRLLGLNYGKPCSHTQLDFWRSEKEGPISETTKRPTPRRRSCATERGTLASAVRVPGGTRKLNLRGHLTCGQCRKSCRVNTTFVVGSRPEKPDNGSAI